MDEEETVTSGIGIDATSFMGNTELFIGKLRRYCDGATAEEMAWTPTGVRNSLGWIVRHCAGLLWLSYGYASGQPIPSGVQGSGIAGSALHGVTFDGAEGVVPKSAEACIADLETAWQALRGVLLEGATALEPRTADAAFDNVWAALRHTLDDVCYHTGQASVLRKLLAVRRRRKRTAG